MEHVITTGPPTSQILDSGATLHCSPSSDVTIQNKQTDPNPVQVKLPDGTLIQNKDKGNLPYNLPAQATETKLFDELDTTLLSTGQLCDAGCRAVYEADRAIVTNILTNETVLTAPRNPATKLWEVNQEDIQARLQNTVEQINLTTLKTTLPERIKFAHASLFSPVPSTLQTALDKGWLRNYPSLTSESFRKHPPNSTATAKGHLDQTRKNVASTKGPPTAPPFLDIEDDLALHPDDPVKPGTPTEAIFVTIWDTRTGQVFSDQTGRFEVPSSKGNQYLFILYHYDSNTIHAEPIPDRQAKTILKAYKLRYDLLVSRGFRPQLHRLDNECSDLLKSFFNKEDVKFQTTPPGIHRRNAAERAIRTFKNHFIAGLCTTDPRYPLCLWDELVPQAELTLNLMRGARLNPKLSAHEYLHGPFDYNATPIAPPGMHVITHDKPKDRKSWAIHGKDAWYVGPSLESYRCHKVWVWETERQRITDTLAWFPPDHLQLPIPTQADLIVAGINDLIDILEHPALHQLDALTQSEAEILRQATEIFLQRIAVDPASQTKLDQTQLKADTATTKLELLKNPEPQPITTPHDTATTNPTRTFDATPRKLDFDTINFLFQNFEPDTLEQCNKAVNPDTGLLAELPELLKRSDGALWNRSNCEEWGRLAQGFDDVQGTNTIHFIHPSNIPKGRKPTYVRLVTADRPQKAQPRRVRSTVGGDRIQYPFDVSTKTADLTTAKILFNSVISTPGARFMSLDIEDFYLNTDLPRYEYIRIQLNQLPPEIIEQYSLLDIAVNGAVYAEVRKGMYGLPQAGRIANDELVPHLLNNGYFQSRHIPGLFKHKTRPVWFALVVDDFGVKYVGKEHAEHIRDILKLKYKITEDWEGKTFCGLHLEWDYENGTVDISMPGYVKEALQQFEHHQTKQEHAPHRWTNTAEVDISPLASEADQKRIYQIVGKFLYYGRAVDNTMLTALSSLASKQSTGTQSTVDDITRLLNYAATHPDATVRFRASQMALHIHSDGAYLNEPKSRSRAAAYFFLTDNPTTTPPEANPPNNGPILVVTNIIKPVVSASYEAEVAAAYQAGQEGCPLRTILEFLGHP